MKKLKAQRTNQVKEPEVEYVKKNRKIKQNRAKTKIEIEEETPKLLTDDDPFMLDELFGMWKNHKITLDKIREKQWGKRR